MKLLIGTRKSTNIDKYKYFDKIEEAIEGDRITLYKLDEFIKNTDCKIEIKYVCGELQIYIDDNNDKPVEIDKLPDEYYESLEKQWLDEEAEAHEED